MWYDPVNKSTSPWKGKDEGQFPFANCLKNMIEKSEPGFFYNECTK